MCNGDVVPAALARPTPAARGEDCIPDEAGGELAGAGEFMAGQGVLPCISAIFESAPGDVTQQRIDRAVMAHISQPHNYIPPQSWRCQEAVRLGLIPAADDRFSSYTESERLFLRHSTLYDWTQAQTQETLKLLRDPAFKTEDLSSDVLRRVSVIRTVFTVTLFITHVSTCLHIITHYSAVHERCRPRRHTMQRFSSGKRW